jgi:hypothetical protein
MSLMARFRRVNKIRIPASKKTAEMDPVFPFYKPDRYAEVL